MAFSWKKVIQVQDKKVEIKGRNILTVDGSPKICYIVNYKEQSSTRRIDHILDGMGGAYENHS